MIGHRNATPLKWNGTYYAIGHPWPLIVGMLVVIGALVWFLARRL
ncbi:MAG: hypothetical protein WAK11_06520 [Candidatus Cybelea sp.]